MTIVNAGASGARGGGAQAAASALRFRIALRRLSVQCQTADRHDETPAEDHQATVRIAPAAFPGKYFSLLLITSRLSYYPPLLLIIGPEPELSVAQQLFEKVISLAWIL